MTMLYFTCPTFQILRLNLKISSSQLITISLHWVWISFNTKHTTPILTLVRSRDLLLCKLSYRLVTGVLLESLAAHSPHPPRSFILYPFPLLVRLSHHSIWFHGPGLDLLLPLSVCQELTNLGRGSGAHGYMHHSVLIICAILGNAPRCTDTFKHLLPNEQGNLIPYPSFGTLTNLSVFSLICLALPVTVSPQITCGPGISSRQADWSWN